MFEGGVTAASEEEDSDKQGDRPRATKRGNGPSNREMMAADPRPRGKPHGGPRKQEPAAPQRDYKTTFIYKLINYT